MKRIILQIALVFGMLAPTFGQVKLNEIQTSNSKTQMDPDFYKYKDWVELYNPTNSAVNLAGFYLTDNKDKPRKWQIPSGQTIAAKGFLLIYCDGEDVVAKAMHTNFKLSSGGDVLYLYSPTMFLADSVKIASIETDYTYGRLADGTGAWGALSKPTPAKANVSTTVKGLAPKPTFSINGGFYSKNQSVALSSSLEGAVIRYTTDGSEPTENSPIYEGAITAEKKSSESLISGYNRQNKTQVQHYQWSSGDGIMSQPSVYNWGSVEKGFVIKAKVFHPDYVPSVTACQTYFINMSRPSLPIVSVSVDKGSFFSADSGIYIQGTNGVRRGGDGDVTANWNHDDWERKVFVEYFDQNGNRQFGVNAGAKVMGAISRHSDLKSLNIIMRKKYEDGKIEYPVFGSEGLDTYESFVLRNSGNDWEQGMFARDAVAQAIVRGQCDLETQAYNPVVMYLNGEYWSIINMRERYDKHYFGGYYDYVDEGNIDLLKINKEKNSFNASDGDSLRYEEMMLYLKQNSMAEAENYEYVKNHYIDVDNMINYYIAQLFCQNTDWPDNNMRLWRPRTENGKFRFPWYDTDFGYGLWGGKAYDDPFTNFYNKKKYAPVVLFDYMMKNDDFKSEFIQRFYYMMNTVYDANRSKGIIQNIEDKIANERSISDSKWQRSETARYSSYLASSVKSFAEERVSNMKGFLNSRYGDKGTAKLTVNYTASQGTVQLCGLNVTSGYNGSQYKSTPIRMTAIPKDGYKFVAWQTGNGQNLSSDLEYKLTITSDYTIKAVFENRSTEKDLYINEFLAANTTDIVSPIGKHEDWIEIYNDGNSAVNLAGLYLSDDRTNLTMHQIPYTQLDSTAIASKGFVRFYADNDYMEGALHLPFKLDKAGGVVILSQKSTNGTVTVLDSIHYEKQNADVSYGRYPDGYSDLTIFTKTTPGTSNRIVSGTEIDGLVITEFMAKNQTTAMEETGTYADWFEIYNSTNAAIDLGGLFVTNNLNNPTMYMIPKGEPTKTTINAGGYYIFWCDKQTAINPNHVDFKLNAEKGDIAIVQLRGSENYIIDQLSYTNQAEDVSMGRYPSTSSDFIYLLNPTPGEANRQSSPVARITGVTINEVLALNTSVTTDEATGLYSDYIEIYNGTSAPIDLGGLYISDSLGTPLRFKIPTTNSKLTTVQAGKWLTFWADGKPELGENHLDFSLDAVNGEDVVLSQLTEEGLVIIDQVSFGPQTANISYGRYPETAENWETMSPTYGVKNQSFNSSVALKTLTSEVGTILPVLSTSILNYECAVPAGTTEAPVISATTVHDRATVTITQAKSLNDVAVIKVISANGYNSEVYKVSFKIAASPDATLATLISAGGTMSPAFNPEVENYVVNLSTAYVPYITAIPSNPNAMVEVDYAETASEATVITVTAEDGSTKQYELTYTMSSSQNIVTEWSDDFSSGIGNLSTNNSIHIIAEHTTPGGFGQPANTDLAVALNEKETDVEYGYVEYHLPKGYVLDGSAALNVSMSLSVPNDGTTVNGIRVSNQYINFSMALVDAYGNVSNYMSGEINPDTKSRSVDFGSASFITKSAIVALRIGLYAPNDSKKERKKAAYIDDLVIGPKVATGQSQVVVLSNNADLATLSSNIGTLSSPFNKDVHEYTLILPAGTETIPTISASVSDETATLEIAQASDLNGVAHVSVISQDMSVINEYAIQLELTPEVVEGHTDLVIQPAMKGWHSSSNVYELNYNGGDIAVAYNRTSASSDAITYNVLESATKILDLTNYPYASVKMKSTVATNLFVELFDATGKKTSSSIAPVACEAGNEMVTYIFDFTQYLGNIDASNVYGMNIYFDKGSATATNGTIKIDELRLGKNVEIVINQAPVWAAIAEQKISQGGSFDNINLRAKVTDDLTDVADLELNLENNVENLTVTLEDGVLEVSPIDPEWIGSEVVKVSATDAEGESATISITYTVEELKIDVLSVSFTQSSIELDEGEQANIADYLVIEPENATKDNITWSVSNKTFATISGVGVLKNQVVYGQEIIEVTVEVTDKNGHEFTKSMEVVLNGCPTKITLVSAESDSIPMYYGETKQLTYSLYPTNACLKSVTYSSSNPDVATISTAGLITASQATKGKTTITITAHDGYSAHTETCDVYVSKDCSGDIELSLNKTKVDLLEDEDFELIATITPDDECTQGKEIVWTSSNESFVTVENGQIHAVAEGSAIITAATTGNGVTSASCEVVVSRDCNSGALEIALSSTKETLYMNGELNLTAEILTPNPCDKKINWSSSKESVVKVQNGTVVPMGYGTAVVRATAAQDENSYAECEITVQKRPVTDIIVTPTVSRMDVDMTQQVTAEILPLEAEDRDIVWSTDNEEIATITQKGVLTGVSEGSVQVIATSVYYKDIVGSCTIQILPVTAISIAMDPSEVVLSVGEKQRVAVTFNPPNTTDKTLTWSSLDEEVARMVGDTIVATGVGSTSIVATTKNNVTGIVTVDVIETAIPVESVTVSPKTLTMNVGEEQTVQAEIFPSNATNQSVDWSSSNETIATVEKGVIKALSPGEVTITASSVNEKTDAVSVVVTYPALSSVSFSETLVNVAQGKTVDLADLLVKEPLSAEAKSIVWSANNENASISDAGILTNNLEYGEANVTVTAVVTDTYGTAKEATITVKMTGCPNRITALTLETNKIVVEKSGSAQINYSIAPMNACVASVEYIADQTYVTVSNGVITPVAIGTTTVQVVVSDGFSTFEKEVEVEVVKDIVPVSSVEIEEGTSLSKSLGDVFTLHAIVLPDDASDKSIVWSSSSESYATVDRDNGTVTLLKEGSVTIKATAHNNESATCRITISAVPVTSLELNKTTANLEMYGTVQLTATVNDDATNKTITWSSTNTDIATVDENGYVEAKGVGTCEIKATAGSITSTCVVTVSHIQPTSLTITPESVTVDIDKSERLRASWLPLNATDTTITWRSEKENIATVSNGVVTGVAAGTTNIIVKVGKNASAVVPVTVNEMMATSITINPTSVTLQPKGQQVLVATVLPEKTSDKSVKWTSSDPTKVSVDENTGKITANALTDEDVPVIITATTKNGIPATCEVSVTVNIIPVESVTINPSEVELQLGKYQTLTAEIYPSNATNKSIVWESSNPSVATVSQYGSVTARSIGTATITAKGGDGMSGTCTVEVKAVEVQEIIISDVSLGITESQLLSATITPSDATVKTLTWSVDDETIATIDATSGKITGESEGTTIVRATAKNDVSGWATVTVSSKAIPVTSIRPNGKSKTINIGDEINLSELIIFNPTNATNKALVWSVTEQKADYEDESTLVATIDSRTGILTSKVSGYIKVSARSVSNPDASPASMTIVVNPIHVTNVVMSETEVELVINEQKTLTAQVMPLNASCKTVKWETDDPNVVSVSSSGVILGLTKGTANIKARSTERNAIYATCKVTVIDEPIREITASADTIHFASAGKMSAITITVNPEDAETSAIEWTTSNPSVVGIDGLWKDNTQCILVANGYGKAIITARASSGAKCEVVCVVAEPVAANTAPTFQPIPAQTLAIDEPVTINLNDYYLDAEGDRIIWTPDENGSNITCEIDGSGKATFSIKDAKGKMGMQMILIKARDGKGAESETNQIIFTLKDPGNQKPDAVSEIQLSDVIAYPNPTSGVFTVSFETEVPQDCKIEIYAMSGRKVFSETVSVFGEYAQEFDLTGYVRGTYFVIVTTGDERKTIKVLLK